ncbi:MAG: rhodanese-like domain-containing protein [Myxococcota bacterium]
MRCVHVVLSAVSLLFGCSAVLSDIDGPEAVQLVSGGARLVDVRSLDEWNSGHIEGAIHIPHGEVAERADEIGGRDQTIIVYCASGVRSYWAKSTLQDLGFSDVRNLGGISEWPSKNE